MHARTTDLAHPRGQLNPKGPEERQLTSTPSSRCCDGCSMGLNTEHDQTHLENNEVDYYWEETATGWIRHHILPRRLRFHPAAATMKRSATTTESQEEDSCKRSLGLELHTSRRSSLPIDEKEKPIQERHLQLNRTQIQGGYLVIYYDERMEHQTDPQMITIAAWKSYKLKRCTVNTLSAECQSMLQGIGQVHWHRFMLCETMQAEMELNTWESQLTQVPFIAVTDS